MDALQKLKKDIPVSQKIQSFDFFLLLAGFLYGNLFGITFSQFNWGIFLIFLIVLTVEFLNKGLYFSSTVLKNKNKNSLEILLNTSKRGFLLGFFIEAFKVGS